MKKWIPHILAMIVVAVLGYWACTDTDGSMDVPTSLDVATYRISQGIRGIVSDAEGEIEATNKGMQKKVHDRARLNDERVDRDQSE